MKRMLLGLGSAGFLVLAGCGKSASDRLAGVWSEAETTSGVTADDSMTLNDDGTASLTVSFSGSVQGNSCAGAITLSGYTWTATDTTITISSGTPVCSGTIQCEGLNLDCSKVTAASSMLGAGTSLGGTSTCNYALSDGDDTLTVTCASSSGGAASTSVLVREDG